MEDDRMKDLIEQFLALKEDIFEIRKTILQYLSSLRTLHCDKVKMFKKLQKIYENHSWPGYGGFRGKLTTTGSHLENFIDYVENDFNDYLCWQLEYFEGTMKRIKTWRTICSEVDFVRFLLLESREVDDEVTIEKYKDHEVSLSKLKDGLTEALEEELSCHLNSWAHDFSKWMRDYFHEETCFHDAQDFVYTDLRRLMNRLHRTTSSSVSQHSKERFEELVEQRRILSYPSLDSSTSQNSDDSESEASADIIPDNLFSNAEAETSDVCSESASEDSLSSKRPTEDILVPHIRLKEETIIEEKEKDESIHILYQVRALVAYTAKTKEEISYDENQIIEIIEESDTPSGHAVGICNGKQGLVKLGNTKKIGG
ncbi:hypothetical protein TNIN_371751 [Trichonephila inaurata madagascariensis]|uniref:SH3 domain-containing protein n=1 Tax=Trichonephila inaurata madagascariensis TaxID=2747483 RepID=A0A8X6XGG7_9ARAC|nr:hypothetical protein TNIN_371751 [Trichonephila inaurata madagascariensis]